MMRDFPAYIWHHLFTHSLVVISLRLTDLVSSNQDRISLELINNSTWSFLPCTLHLIDLLTIRLQFMSNVYKLAFASSALPSRINVCLTSCLR